MSVVVYVAKAIIVMISMVVLFTGTVYAVLKADKEMDEKKRKKVAESK